MNYSFRVLDLKKSVAENLAEALAAYQPNVKQQYGRRGYCLSLKITKKVKKQVLVNALKTRGIKPNKADIFASLLAQRDTAIIGVPKEIAELLCALRCKLTFSFTYVG